LRRERRARHRRHLQFDLVHKERDHAGHLGQDFCGKLLGDDFGLDRDRVAREPRRVFLAIFDAKRGVLALDALLGRGLGGAGRLAADDVGNAGDLVELGLRLVERLVQREQRLHDHVERHEVHRLRDAALGDELGPILHADQAVIDAFLQDALQLGDRSVIDAVHPHRVGQRLDARGEAVELVGLVLVLDVIRHRHQRVIGERRVERHRARERSSAG
jgi:hypothetical protein